MSYSSQEIVASKKYQNLTPSQKSMFLQVFGNRSDITPEMFNSFVAQTSNLPDDKQSNAGGTSLMASPLAIPVVIKGAKYLYNSLTGKVVDETGKEVAKEIAGEVAKESVKQGASQLATQGVPEVTQIGSTVDGGAIMSDGSITSPSMAGSVMSNLSSLGAVQGTGVGAGVLGGTYLVGKGINDLLKNRTDNSGKGVASRVQTGITTGGISEGIRAIRKLFESKTKDAELKSLKEAIKRGDISEQDAQGYLENAGKFGKGGRAGINVEQNYQDRLKSDGEAEAQRFKQYSQLVKEGNDVEANKLLRGKDIMGYANVIKTISDTTGKKYGDYDMTTREKLAQTIADYNRENQGAIYGDKGTLNVKLDDTLKAKLLDSLNSKTKPTIVQPNINTATQANTTPAQEQTSQEKQKVNLNDLKKLWR